MSLLSWWHFMHSDFVTMRILCFSGEWHFAHSIPTSFTCRACGNWSSISRKNTLSDGITRAWHRVAQYADGEARIAGFGGAAVTPPIRKAAGTRSKAATQLFRCASSLLSPGNATPDSLTSTDRVWHPLHETCAENIRDAVSGTPLAPPPMYLSFR